MRYLLDTNVVIALLNDTSSGPALHARREKTSDMAVSAVVFHELFFGAYNSSRLSHNLAIVDALQFPVLEFDKEDARKSGEVRAYLKSKGVPIGAYDLLIAGQALARNMIVVTHNRREFVRVPGLQMEDWQA
jgi:tRNA(fMet)-specific endonuclease VapC